VGRTTGRGKKSIADKPSWCRSPVSGKGPDEALGTCRSVGAVVLDRHAGRTRERTWDEPPFAAATPVRTPLWRPFPSAGATSARRTPETSISSSAALGWRSAPLSQPERVGVAAGGGEGRCGGGGVGR
jgi:hypothetical protein